MNIYSRKADMARPGLSFLTHHAHVLLLIARQSDVRMRDLASGVGITERAVQRIVDDLAATGYIRVTKEGRRNHYNVATGHHLWHPLEMNCTIGDFLHCINCQPLETSMSAASYEVVAG